MIRHLVPQSARHWLRIERNHLRDAAVVAANVAPFAPRLPVTLRLAFAPRLRILCYPRHPSRWQALYKICALNGYRIVVDPAEGYDLAVHFTDGGACELPAHVKVLNRRCTDVSKTHVASVFQRVFGYGLAVDPTSYKGLMVQKSDGNYTHDGRILNGPIPRADITAGQVYQRLIDNAEAAEAIDLRTPLYSGRVPFVYIKRRPLASRFANQNSSVEVRQPAEVYSAEELAALSRFGLEMGLDYGELDVLRDGTDGRIYVVDVANTPAGPPNGMSEAAAKTAIHRLAREFRVLVNAA